MCPADAVGFRYFIIPWKWTIQREIFERKRNPTMVFLFLIYFSAMGIPEYRIDNHPKGGFRFTAHISSFIDEYSIFLLILFFSFVFIRLKQYRVQFLFIQRIASHLFIFQ